MPLRWLNQPHNNILYDYFIKISSLGGRGDRIWTRTYRIGPGIFTVLLTTIIFITSFVCGLDYAFICSRWVIIVSARLSFEISLNVAILQGSLNLHHSPTNSSVSAPIFTTTTFDIFVLLNFYS